MAKLRYTVALMWLLLFMSGCASVHERQAFSDWNQEGRKWAKNDMGNAHFPVLDQGATLDDYVLYALLNNSGLAAHFARWKAALEKIAPARTLPDPRFTYANYIREVETRVGAQEQKFGVAQRFPWFGKLDLREDMAFQEAQAQRQQYEAAKLALIFRVKKVYYEYSYLGQATDITRDNVTLLSYLERVARTKYKSGKGNQSAIIRIQVELGKLEDRLRTLQDMMVPVAAKLNTALNRPAQMPVPIPKALPEVKAYDAGHEDLLSALRTRNPNLKYFDFMATKQDAAIRLAEKDFYPDVTLGLDYIDTAPRSDANPVDNGKDPVIAMLSVNLPVWQQKYTAVRTEAEARRRSILKDRKEKENQLIADLEMALYQLRDAERRIDLYGDTLLPKAEQAMKVTQQAFTTDKASFLDLIDSQRILLQFQLDHRRALIDHAQRLAEIEMLTGGSPDWQGPGQSGQEVEK